MEDVIAKKETIKALKNKLLEWEGFQKKNLSASADFGLGSMNKAFPGEQFPVGVIHELISQTEACVAATTGFIGSLLATLMHRTGIVIWIRMRYSVFPPALKFYGVEPDQIIFIDVRNAKEGLWVMEQALKCSALVAVVAEINTVSFAESRRLQLIAEDSGVTGFLHRQFCSQINILATVARWRIRPLAGITNGLPGVGFPCVEVELEKIRNGKPGYWEMSWRSDGHRISELSKKVHSLPVYKEKIRTYA